MLQESTRPFTQGERRLLRQRSVIPKVGSVYWMQDERRIAFWTIGMSLGVVLLGLLLRFPFVGITLGIGLALLRFSSYRERRTLRQWMLLHRFELAEELSSGQAYSITCSPTRIFEREEFEDEGAAWIFDGGNGRYLALCGQDYYETPRFPSANFEIVMSASRKALIGIRSRGPRIPSTLVVRGSDDSWETLLAKDVMLFDAPAKADLPEILRCLSEANTP